MVVVYHENFLVVHGDGGIRFIIIGRILPTCVVVTTTTSRVLTSRECMVD
nr:MAG TPA: hypothetical protein [Caudoviricetes sp.]